MSICISLSISLHLSLSLPFLPIFLSPPSLSFPLCHSLTSSLLLNGALFYGTVPSDILNDGKTERHRVWVVSNKSTGRDCTRERETIRGWERWKLTRGAKTREKQRYKERQRRKRKEREEREGKEREREMKREMKAGFGGWLLSPVQSSYLLRSLALSNTLNLSPLYTLFLCWFLFFYLFFIVLSSSLFLHFSLPSLVSRIVWRPPCLLKAPEYRHTFCLVGNHTNLHLPPSLHHSLQSPKGDRILGCIPSWCAF